MIDQDKYFNDMLMNYLDRTGEPQTIETDLHLDVDNITYDITLVARIDDNGDYSSIEFKYLAEVTEDNRKELNVEKNKEVVANILKACYNDINGEIEKYLSL